MPLLNYTTKIDADKTVNEIQKALSKAGAMKTMTDYDKGIISAVSFALKVNDQIIGFRLPCDWRPVYAVLEAQIPLKLRRGLYGDAKKQEQDHKESERRLQAVRTAWRIVKDWVEAQCALIETQMVKTEQVFLPYMVMKGGNTLYEGMVDTQFRLESGE